MFPWDDTAVATLRDMWSKGYSASQIAHEIRCESRSAVLGKINRLGLLGRMSKVQPKRQRPPQPAPIARRKPAHQRPIEFRGPPIAPAEMPRATADDIARVTLIDLEPHHCRWPVGEPTAGFCGCPKVPGSSYCEGHLARAFRVQQVISRAPARVREYA